MKKVWNFILKNRIYIVLVLLVLFFAFVFVTMKAYLDPEDANAVYGNRLDGIENVTITDEKVNEVVNFIKEDNGVSDASLHIKGKIVNIIIKVSKKENTIDKMKEKSKEIIEKFSKEEIEFYDFQFFIKNEDGNYNLMGYKNKKNENISWSSDEIISEVDENEEKQ